MAEVAERQGLQRILGWIAAAGDRTLARIPDRAWRIGVPAVYLALVLPTLASHAFWFDEAQSWLISKESRSLPDLLSILRLEGHPPLWYLILWPFAHSFSSPEWMKIPTALLTATSAIMLPRVRGLRRMEQLLILGGFTMVLGYSTVSRSYILGVALTILYLWVATVRPNTTLELVIVSLLVLTHAAFAVLAGALFWTSLARRQKENLDSGTLAWHSWFLVALVPLLTLGVALLVINPEAYGMRQVLHLHDVWGSLPGAFLPASLATLDFSSTLVSAVWASAVALATVLLVLLMIDLARSVTGRPFSLVVIILLINAAVGYGREWWHLGIIYWALIPGVVLSRSNDLRPTDAAPGLRYICFRPLLAFPVAASLLWWTSSVSSLPFSPERQAAEIIRSVCPSGCPLVTDDYGTTVSAYLGGPPVYQLHDRASRTFQVHDSSILAKHPITWDALRKALSVRGDDAVAFLIALRDPPPDFQVLGTTDRGAIWLTRPQTGWTLPGNFIVVRLRADH